MRRRAKGEGSLLKIYGKKDAKGHKKPVSEIWYAQYVHNGKQVRVSTGETSKMKALGVLRRLMGDRDRGLAPLPESQKLRYADLRRGLIANYEERGNRSLTTYADGEENINGLRQLDDFFNYSESNPGPPLPQITTETSREFARKRQADGVGTATVNRSLACLRRMLRIAHEDGRIQHVPKIRFLKEPPPRKGFLELEKFNELLALLPTYLQPLILLLYYCGLRVDEGRQIEWPAVDLDAHLIRLEAEQTKTDEARTVPLPAQLVMMLRAIEPKTGKVFDDTNLRNEWQKACAACGQGTRTLIEPEKEDAHAWYKYTGLLVHDLRRSAVRNLVNAGVPERVAMQISGHKTRAVFDRYHIVSTDDVTKAMSRLELNGPRISESEVK
jgi:integrase